MEPPESIRSNTLTVFFRGFLYRTFKAVGGIITLALGLKLSKIKHYDAINLLPAIILVFFISHLWSLLPF